jgi:hypothetical protein
MAHPALWNGDIRDLEAGAVMSIANVAPAPGGCS